jgi:osmoprotectant transport system permease protein
VDPDGRLVIGNVWDWFRDPANWQGDDGVPHRLVEHSLLTGASMLIALAVGLPLALWLGHRRRGGTVLVNLTNVGRAVPIIALLSLLSLSAIGTADFGPFGRAGLATLITLALFALPPIVIGTYVGVTGVDADVVEAARGMGLSEWEVLRSVELPLALPAVVSGIRLAVVQVWATATIAALVAGPGLGRIIIHGYDSNHQSEVVAGSLIVAVIALLLEAGFALLQRAVDPVPAAAVPAGR